MRAVFALIAAAAAKGAVELTTKNFDDVVFNSGKGAFIKFLAPWWGHCKKMKPDWDKLGSKFADSESVVIADVDCTEKSAESICSKYGVKGYPTIKYKLEGDKSFKDYQGAREFGPMKDFADKTFKKPCDVKTKKGCAPNEVEFIDKWTAKTMEELTEEKNSRDKELKQIRKDKSDAQAEMKTKEKEWTKKEKLITKSLSLLKTLEKAKKAEL